MRHLKIPTLKSTTEQGHYDKDYILMHAAFTLLVDFFEKEFPEETSDLYDESTEERDPTDPQRKVDWLRLKSLYNWWKYCYNENDRTDMFFDEFCHERLVELTQLSRMMWT